MSYQQRPNTPNYYAILGVAPTASAEEVKRAFRNRALLHHPDRCSSRGGVRPGSTGMLQARLSLSGEGAPEGSGIGGPGGAALAPPAARMQDLEEKIATQNFQLIGEAYAVLSDETSRQQYDAEFGFAGARRCSFDGSGGNGSSGEGSAGEEELGGSTFKHQDLDSFFAHLESKAGSSSAGAGTGTGRRPSVIGTGFGVRPASKMSTASGRPPTHPGSVSKTPNQQPLFPKEVSVGVGGFPRPSSTQRMQSAEHFTTFEFPLNEEAPIRAGRPEELFTPPIQKTTSATSNQPSYAYSRTPNSGGSASMNRSTLPSMKVGASAATKPAHVFEGAKSFNGASRPLTALDSLAQTLHGGDLASFLTDDDDWEDRERNRWLDDARSRWDRRFVVSRNGEVSRRREPFFAKPRSTTATPSMTASGSNRCDAIPSRSSQGVSNRLPRSDQRNTGVGGLAYPSSEFGERQPFGGSPMSAMRRQVAHRSVLVTPAKTRANMTDAHEVEEVDRQKKGAREYAAHNSPSQTVTTSTTSTPGSAHPARDGKKEGRGKLSAAQRIEEARRRTWELFLQPSHQSQSYTVK
jgi:curved DNA-binding protein CbpA